jgi:hypothetical protein
MVMGPGDSRAAEAQGEMFAAAGAAPVAMPMKTRLQVRRPVVKAPFDAVAAAIQAGIDPVPLAVIVTGDPLAFGAQAVGLAVLADGGGPLRAALEVPFGALGPAVKPGIDAISQPVEMLVDAVTAVGMTHVFPVPPGAVVTGGAVFGHGGGGAGQGDEQGG